MNDSALDGRRIINTRPAAQAAGLSAALAERGAVPVEIPMIEVIEHPAAAARFDELSAELHRFAWIVVTSPNGAAVVRRSLTEGAAPTRIAAVGQASAEALGVPVALIPRQSNGHGLIAEFPRGRGEVLVIQSAGAAPTVVDGLTAAGWTVTALATHEAVPVAPTEAQRREAIDADALVLASGSAARSWATSMVDRTPPVVVAIGPQCAAAATRSGLDVTAVAERYDIAGVLSTLSRVFAESIT